MSYFWFRVPSSLMTLTISEALVRLYRKSFILDLSEVFFIIKQGLRIWGRKITAVKCCSHYIIQRFVPPMWFITTTAHHDHLPPPLWDFYSIKKPYFLPGTTRCSRFIPVLSVPGLKLVITPTNSCFFIRIWN